MVSISLGSSSKLDKSGGTLTGPLILARDPQQPLEAATRQWVLANGGGIPPGTVTAKGDLIAATGNAAVTRLGVGTDGQVLSAASAQGTGLRWISLGTAAAQNTTAFDAAGAAASALAAAEANAAATYVPLTAEGAVNGVATLDGSGHLTAGQSALLLAAADNLAAVADKPTARGNLGLGAAAVLGVGTIAGTVAAGDDSRITGAVQSAGTGLTKTGTQLALTTPVSAANLPRLDQLTAPQAAVGMNSQKLTSVANGTLATDGAAFGQIPVVGSAGSGAGNALSANDATTTNARTPTAHASTHAVGGTDILTPDAIGAVSSDWASMLGVALLTAKFTESGVTYQQTPGDLVLCLCTAPKTKTISKLALWVTAAGVTGSGANALALFDETGNLIDQTGDMTTAWSSTGMPEGILGGSHTVTAGTNYYLGFLTHFSGTSPHCGATGTAQTANFPVANGRRTAIFKSSQAAIPLSFDPSSYTPNSGYFVMYAR